MRLHLLATAVILTVATGCDNVAWGGVDVRWVPPSDAAPGALAVAPDPEGDQPSPIAAAPLLLAGVRDGARATLVVVGAIRDGALSESGAAPPAPDSEWILFAEGVRIGSMRADRVGTADDFCGSPASVSGVVELVPVAATAERFLALPVSDVENAAYEAFRPLTHEYEQRVATLALAQEAIPRVGARWPPDGVLSARQDIRAFQPLGTALPSVAATFLYRDQLAVAPPVQGAYALFILASPSGDEYRAAYEWYQAADASGKAAPRYFDHLDWDRDGDGEVLLEVFGSERRWHAALERRDGEWVRSFEDPCGAGASPGN